MRTRWIVAGVVCWTLFVGFQAVVVPPPVVLCTLVGVTPADPNRCNLAELNASAAAQQGMLWLVLWVAGLIVAGAFMWREIAAGRVPA